jgi:esterase
MELFYHKLGKGKPLIILHGLYGSSDNWYTLGKQLSGDFEVYLIDQRNHGHSPRHPLHSYIALRDDLHEFIVHHSLFKPVLLGHSMGGRTVMFFAASHPKLVEKICVVDISPCSYKPENHPVETLQQESIIHSLNSIDLLHLSNRKDADRQLANTIGSTVIRQFLLKNLKINKKNEYYWSINLHALSANLHEVYTGIDTLNLDSRFQMTFPALFIKGQHSGYIKEKDIDCIHRYFSNSSIVTIPDAGHWVHAEQPALFLETIKKFLVI